MVSVHGYPQLSFKAGATCATTTAIYKAVYMSADNTVDICNTSTTLSKFIGISQNYVKNTGDAIPVVVEGPSKVTVCGSCTVAFGELVGIAVNTTTANGSVLKATGKVANTAGGSDLVIGKCLFGAGATGSTTEIAEIDIKPTFITAFTTTIAG